MNKSELQNDRDLKVFFIKYFKIIFILSFFPHCIDTIRGGDVIRVQKKVILERLLNEKSKLYHPTKS